MRNLANLYTSRSPAFGDGWRKRSRPIFGQRSATKQWRTLHRTLFSARWQDGQRIENAEDQSQHILKAIYVVPMAPSLVERASLVLASTISDHFLALLYPTREPW